MLDGVSGAQLYVCQAEQPITSITLTSECLVTAHIGNCVQFWELKTQVRMTQGVVGPAGWVVSRVRLGCCMLQGG